MPFETTIDVKLCVSVVRLIKDGENFGLCTITCERKAKLATKRGSNVRVLAIILCWVSGFGGETRGV